MNVSYDSNTCRLCTSSGVLSNIYKMDGTITLSAKTTSCIEIKISPDDGLSSLICNQCEIYVKLFYNFKQKCIEIDSKLKSVRKITSKSGLLVDNCKSEMEVEFESVLGEPENCYRDTMDVWLSDDINTTLDSNNLQKDFNNKADKHFFYRNLNSTEIFENKELDTRIKKSKLSSKDKQRKNVYQCDLCGHVFKMKSTLKNHFVTHTGEKSFKCEVCPKKFTRAEHKRVHMRSHFGIKPFICEVCGKSFTKNQDLLRHQTIHSDEKKYSCPQCQRKFKRSNDIHIHMRTHTGARPYPCKTCGKRYSCHSSLRKHYEKYCKKEQDHLK